MMKKIFLFGFLVVMALASCTKESHLQNDALDSNLTTITAYISGDNNDPSTKLSVDEDVDNNFYTLTWESDDQISILHAGANATFTKADTGENDFTGTLPDGEGLYYAMYPLTTGTDVIDPEAVPFDISGGISSPILYAISTDGKTFPFHHAMAFLKLSIQGVTGRGTVTITTSYGVYTSGTINLGNGRISSNSSSKRTIVLNDVNLGSEIFIAVPPMPSSKKGLTVQVVQGGITYQGNLGGEAGKSIDAGKYYTASVTVNKVVPAAQGLGLSVEWATFNLGATNEHQYGEYYAWGETQPKDTYGWPNYKFCNGTKETLTKYVYAAGTTVGEKLKLDSSDDAAGVNWGEGWRIPTEDEWQELIDNCTWDHYTEGSFNGYKITSNKEGYQDNFIILPKAGYRYGSTQSGVYCSYWSSELTPYDPQTTYGNSEYVRVLSSNSIISIINTNRANGHSIRPVRDLTNP